MLSDEEIREAFEWRDKCLEKNKRIAELESELMEQARVNGMGGEREAALLGKVQRLESTVKKAMGALNTVEWHGGGSCWIVDADAIEEAIGKCKEVLHADK